MKPRSSFVTRVGGAGRASSAIAVACAAAAALATGTRAAAPMPAAQSDAAFAASYATFGVTNVSATTGRVSCYAPEVAYLDALTTEDGYPGGGMTPCPGATTGEQIQGFTTQDVSNVPMLVKDKSESDLRVDPQNPRHIIGTSKWFVSAEGYNHLLGFYEFWDGGRTWPVQGHVPASEGWTSNSVPVGDLGRQGLIYISPRPALTPR